MEKQCAKIPWKVINAAKVYRDAFSSKMNHLIDVERNEFLSEFRQSLGIQNENDCSNTLYNMIACIATDDNSLDQYCENLIDATQVSA